MVLLVAIVASLWLTVGRGFSAREEPSAVETFLARGARSLAIPRSAKDTQNPVVQSPDVLSRAMSHFADHCAFCHANDGSGDTSIGRGLYPKPPDMRQRPTQDLTDGELFYIIHNGIRLTGMPAFGEPGVEPDLDSWELVHFIRHLPNITETELEEMKRLNPKSPAQIQEEEDLERFLKGEDVQPTPHAH